MQVPTNIRKDQGVRAMYLAEIVDFPGNVMELEINLLLGI